MAASACGSSAPPGSAAAPAHDLTELAQWRPAGALDGAGPEPVQARRPTGRDPLASFHAALDELRRGRRRAPVLVVQFGDSHTAGPYMVARLREVLQERYGALGPGKLPPGRAPRFWRPQLVTVEQEGDWQASSALRAGSGGPFGIAGYRLSSASAGSRIVLRATEPEGFDHVILDVLAQPGGGTFRLRVDNNESPPLRTAGRGGAANLTLDLQQRASLLAVEVAGDGPVDLLAWGVQRQGRGVVVEGHGINGATIDMLANMDPAILARDLATRPPALIILAFGTNEATDPRLTEDQYAATLADRVRMLRRMVPGASLLLVGAPDGARRGRASACGWEPLPTLAEVRAAQRRVVQTERLASWDWSSVTGGSACRLDALARADTPLVHADRVHLTAEGYRLSGERLAQAILPGGPAVAQGT